MVDIPTSALTGSLRVGLHVVSNYKKPVLEIYHEVTNRFGPEQSFDIPKGHGNNETYRQTMRHQDIGVYFILANIGGVRAENIKLYISGKLRRAAPRLSFGDFFERTIPQLGPGQTLYLFDFMEFDLFEYAEGSTKPTGMKKETFTITAEYDAPAGIVNTPLSWMYRIFGSKRFAMKYTFIPELVTGDLPPPEYVA